MATNMTAWNWKTRADRLKHMIIMISQSVPKGGRPSRNHTKMGASTLAKVRDVNMKYVFRYGLSSMNISFMSGHNQYRLLTVCRLILSAIACFSTLVILRSTSATG